MEENPERGKKKEDQESSALPKTNFNSSGPGKEESKWIRVSKWAFVVIVVFFLIVVVIIYPVIKYFEGDKNYFDNFFKGMFMALLTLSLFVIVIPTALKFFKEDILGKPEEEPEKWMIRLRTVITVAVTLLLLVFVVAWYNSSEKLVVQQPVTGSTGDMTNASVNATLNATQATTTELHPFVITFMDVYKIIIGFFFGVSAVETIAKKLKQ